MEFTDDDLDAALEAIDRIRAHKNRPDLPRIARYLYRLYNFSSDKTIKILEHLLGRNRVKEVVYKGNISYRNPLKWKWPRNFNFDPKPTQEVSSLNKVYRENMNIDNKRVAELKFESIVVENFEGNLSIKEEDLIKKEEVTDRLSMNDQSSYVTSLEEKQDIRTIEIETSEESECEKIIDTPMEIEPRDIPEEDTVNTAEVRHRKGDRLSRKKKTKYDPSEYFFPPLIRKKKEKPASVKVPKKRGRPLKKKVKKLKDADPSFGIKEPKIIPICLKKSDAVKCGDDDSPSLKLSKNPSYTIVKDLKLKEVEVNRGCCCCNGQVDLSDFTGFSCHGCNNVVHEKCLVNEKLGNPSLAKWYCPDCKSKSPTRCCICQMDSSLTPVLMCDTCEEVFHPDCHIPKVKLPLSNKLWTCSNCPSTALDDIKYSILGGSIDLKSTVGTHAFRLVEDKEKINIGIFELSKNNEVDNKSSNDGPAVVEEEQIIDDSNNKIEEEGRGKGEEMETVLNETGDNIKLSSNDDKAVELGSVESESVLMPSNTVIKQEGVAGEDSVSNRCPSSQFGRHRPNDPIPNVDCWSTRDVSDYFTDRLGPDVGLAFLSQEIDGKGLKMMSRADVTESLGLKLGQSLKVLYYVKKIQLKTNQLRFLWL